MYDDIENDGFYVAAVDLDNDICQPSRFIRAVKSWTKAGQLLDTAFSAWLDEDAATFYFLPVRIGPSTNMWVLADAPYALGIVEAGFYKDEPFFLEDEDA
ncbi:hypothetical protein [Rhodopseudomonas sp. NSM]|uniref:hypothetical protein n=1 Tax=Rhodopseudomonas sp. NSM TaxID=3457630 RepID=UPI004035284E